MKKLITAALLGLLLSISYLSKADGPPDAPRPPSKPKIYGV